MFKSFGGMSLAVMALIGEIDAVDLKTIMKQRLGEYINEEKH